MAVKNHGSPPSPIHSGSSITTDGEINNTGDLFLGKRIIRIYNFKSGYKNGKLQVISY